jgi:hypothetical protein
MPYQNTTARSSTSRASGTMPPMHCLVAPTASRSLSTLWRRMTSKLLTPPPFYLPLPRVSPLPPLLPPLTPSQPPLPPLSLYHPPWPSSKCNRSQLARPRPLPLLPLHLNPHPPQASISRPHQGLSSRPTPSTTSSEAPSCSGRRTAYYSTSKDDSASLTAPSAWC